VELLIVLGVLYGLQCLTWLPGGAELFVQPLRGWLVSSGPGWRLLHPIPSGRATLAARFPLVEQEWRLYGRGAASWSSGSPSGSRGVPVEWEALGRATVRGSVVRVDGRPFARGLGAAHAEALAASLRELAGAAPEADRESVARALERELSLERFTAAQARVVAATRWLGRSSDLYWVGLFGWLPVSVAWLGDERGLWLSLPALAVLHLSTLVCFARAHRRLLPGRTGTLLESLISAAFYPPLLLRAHHRLRTEGLAGFHPAVVAAAVLPPELRRAFLRAELVRASERGAAASQRDAGLGLDELELRGLRGLLCELGESEQELRAPPERSDPFARAYCPACLCEYRGAGGRCADCGVGRVPYRT
jgi:hypothetical protein